MSATVIWDNLSTQPKPNWLAVGFVLALHLMLLWAMVQLYQPAQRPDFDEPLQVNFIELSPTSKVKPTPQIKRAPEPEPKSEPVPEKTPPITQPRPEPVPMETAPPPPKPVPRQEPSPPREPSPQPVRWREPAPQPSPRREPSPQIQEGIRAVVRVPAVYPTTAKLAGIEGYVALEFTVQPDGSVADIVVIDAQPPVLFNQAAKEALRNWRFQPRIQDGQTVAAKARQTIRFDLK